MSLLWCAYRCVIWTCTKNVLIKMLKTMLMHICICNMWVVACLYVHLYVGLIKLQYVKGKGDALSYAFNQTPPNQSDVLDACMNTHEAACSCIFWHVSTYLCVHIVWVWACTRACKCLCVSVSVSPCFSLCVCAHTWMHACACVCVSMHAHSVCVSEKEVQQGICWPLVTHRERERWAMGHRGWVAL